MLSERATALAEPTTLHLTSTSDLIALSGHSAPCDDAPPAAVQVSSDHFFVPVEPVAAHGGEGVVAATDIAAGRLVVMFGGFVTPGDDFRRLNHQFRRYSFQIGDDLFLVGAGYPNHGNLINHSCDPNLAITGDVSLSARRDIAAGELLTYDYATSDSQPIDEFACYCGTPACREKVTGEDWLDREIQARYDGEFAPYLARKIAAVNRW